MNRKTSLRALLATSMAVALALTAVGAAFAADLSGTPIKWDEYKSDCTGSDARDLDANTMLWHFVLANPAGDSGELTAQFNNAGTKTKNGSVDGGEIHFVVVTDIPQTLQSASTDIDGDLSLSYVCAAELADPFPTPEPTPEPTAEPTPKPTPKPEATSKPTPKPEAEATPEPEATSTPTATPVAPPPDYLPTPPLTGAAPLPTAEPEPTVAPTAPPTPAPTAEPTPEPTEAAAEVAVAPVSSGGSPPPAGRAPNAALVLIAVLGMITVIGGLGLRLRRSLALDH